MLQYHEFMANSERIEAYGGGEEATGPLQDTQRDNGCTKRNNLVLQNG
jgi:hypothetical protein